MFARMEMSPEELVLVGILGRPHGVRGQIRCFPQTHDISRHKQLKEVYVQKQKSLQKLIVESSSSGNNFWLLKFKEFNTPESVASLTHGELLISPEERLPVPDDQYYLSDFSEFLAYSENNEFLGNIVECLELPSVNAFFISFSQEKQKDFSTKEILAPWIDDCVLDIDESAKKIIFSTQFLKSLCPEKDS